jgi:hypothetical protein
MAFDKFDFVLFPAASHHWVRRGPSSGYDSDHSLHCRGNNPKKGGGGGCFPKHHHREAKKILCPDLTIEPLLGTLGHCRSLLGFHPGGPCHSEAGLGRSGLPQC